MNGKPRSSVDSSRHVMCMPNSRSVYAVYLYYAMISSSIPADALDTPVALLRGRMCTLGVGLGCCVSELYGLRRLLSPDNQHQISVFTADLLQPR